MSQERTTSLRILQTNKKNSLSPVLYILIGFIVGVVFTVLLFFIFFQMQMGGNSTPIEAIEQNTVTTVEAKTNVPVVENTVPVRHETAEVAPNKGSELVETTEVEEDAKISQPRSNDLSKFFQRESTAPAHVERHTSPFANEPTAKTTPVAPQTKTVHPPKAIPAHLPSKPIAQPIQAALVKEPELEAPAATVQIKVTQRPVEVSESPKAIVASESK